MLDFDTALGLLNKYGYTSISVPPYVYQNDKSIGVCYTYLDEDYGELERIRIFEKVEEFEEFLKKYSWYCNNGKNYNVRMILDNYESINPKVIFLRNEKIMVEGEMFDIDNYDARESQREFLDDVSKVIYEAGDLLLVYDEIKGRQLQYLKNIIDLKNELRTRYYDLQREVDTYNKYKVERELKLLPEIADLGINENLEIAIKDKYNKFVAVRPSYEEAVSFLKEVWDFILALELNTKFYEAQKEENDVRNERKVVEQKISLMKKLNENLKPLFGVDLVSKFKKINKTCKDESSTISNESIRESIDAVRRKYSFFEKLDILNTSDYLREAIQNTNYEDLALKYAKDSNVAIENFARKPLNEVAANLTVQYKEKLDIGEQAILVLYNNKKYRTLFDCILNLESFETMPIKQIVRKLNGIKDFSKLKSECYDSVKRRIDDPLNSSIKQSLFANYDFTTFDSFIQSVVGELKKLRTVNNKMTIDGNINMYLLVRNENDIKNKKFVMVTNDLTSLYIKSKESHEMIGITLLKEKTPVLYSPYYFDLGDIYSKDASPQMSINEMINFELLIDTTDIVINIDPNKTKVVKYQSTPKVVENLSIVDDIKKYSKTIFCKFAFNSSLVNASAESEQQVDVRNVEGENNDVDNSLNTEVVVPVANTQETPAENVIINAENENSSDDVNIEKVEKVVEEPVNVDDDRNNIKDSNNSEKVDTVLENNSESTEDNVVLNDGNEVEVTEEETSQKEDSVFENEKDLSEDTKEEATEIENKESSETEIKEENAIIEEKDSETKKLVSEEVNEEKKDEEVNTDVSVDKNILVENKKFVNKNVMHTGSRINSVNKNTVVENKIPINSDESEKKVVTNVSEPQTIVKKVNNLAVGNKNDVPKMIVNNSELVSNEKVAEEK